MEKMKLFDSAAVAQYLGIGRSTFFELKKDPDFPPPVRLYQRQRKLLWAPEDIDRFVALKAGMNPAKA